MTDPKPDEPVHDDLDLDAETVKDLEADPQSADEVRGGNINGTGTSGRIGCG